MRVFHTFICIRLRKRISSVCQIDALFLAGVSCIDPRRFFLRT